MSPIKWHTHTHLFLLPEIDCWTCELCGQTNSQLFTHFFHSFNGQSRSWTQSQLTKGKLHLNLSFVALSRYTYYSRVQYSKPETTNLRNHWIQDYWKQMHIVSKCENNNNNNNYNNSGNNNENTLPKNWSLAVEYHGINVPPLLCAVEKPETLVHFSTSRSFTQTTGSIMVWQNGNITLYYSA